LLLKGTVAQLPTDAEERATIRKILQTNLARLRFQSETARSIPPLESCSCGDASKPHKGPIEIPFRCRQFLNSLEFWQSRLSVSIDAPAPNMRFISRDSQALGMAAAGGLIAFLAAAMISSRLKF
jgi:hypothetical protein